MFEGVQRDLVPRVDAKELSLRMHYSQKKKKEKKKEKILKMDQNGTKRQNGWSPESREMDFSNSGDDNIFPVHADNSHIRFCINFRRNKVIATLPMTFLRG